MHPLGAQNTSAAANRKGLFSGRGSALGMAVMAVVFLVAVLFAANENDVIGWIIALVAFGWLVLATFVVVSIRRAAKFGATQIRQAQENFRSATGRASNDGGGTKVVSEVGRPDTSIRDQKLAHSFKIVQVQARLVEENLGKDGDTVARALETIHITAHNGMGLLKGDDDEPLSGKIVD